MKKVLKWLLIGIVAIALLFGAAMIFIIYIFVDSTSDEGVYGDVVVLQEENIKVGDVVALVFKVPEEFSDLHKEMWDCHIEVEGEEKSRFDYILERDKFEEIYTIEEIEEMFSTSPINIYEEDDGEYKVENSPYSSKVALFIPQEAGVYYISILGYYHSTSPSEYGRLKVLVYE